MTLTLFLLFTVLPLIELSLLFWIGSTIGGFNTLMVILVSGIIGTLMARHEGASILRRLQETLKQGKAPGNQITEGFMILCGGLLLITPGMLTDIFGFSMLFAPVRRKIAPIIKKQFLKRLNIQDMSNIQGDGMYAGPFSAGSAQKEEKITEKPSPKKAAPKMNNKPKNKEEHNQLFDNGGWDHPIVD